MADMHPPWTDTETDYGYSRIVDANGDEICEVWDFGEKTLGARVALICAAPDLLDALWVLTEHNTLHFGEDHNTVIQGRAAIAKAKETTCT